MGYARKTQVCLDATPYYHVVARCVRRAWLWGVDHYAGKDYSHRKAWVLERLKYLADSFAIDLCAYAVMSNHYHLVVRVDRAGAAAWTPEQVVERWGRLFKLPTLIEEWREGSGGEAVREAAEVLIEHWRENLSSISRYMACLNEYLARRANAEDDCTGRFWEGRFKSQALLDEAGLLTAMAYVDLNPVRAGIAATPEESEFTSIHARIQHLRRPTSRPAGMTDEAIDGRGPHLLAFCDDTTRSAAKIPFTLIDYVQLIDWSGRAVRPDKAGAIDPQAPAILTRLNIDPDAWQAAMRPAGNVFGRALGQLNHLRLHARALGQSWVKGLREAERLYRTT
jgi:REP element-mobilizing transposase RayT